MSRQAAGPAPSDDYEFACSHVGLPSRTRAHKRFLQRPDRMCPRLLGTHPLHRQGSALPSSHKSSHDGRGYVPLELSLQKQTAGWRQSWSILLEEAWLMESQGRAQTQRPWPGHLPLHASGSPHTKPASQGDCEVEQAEMSSTLGQCLARTSPPRPSPLRALLPPLWGSLCPPGWRLRRE